MIKDFLIERRDWIGFYFLVQLLILFVTFIDSTIPFESVLYIVFLSIILFIVFLIVRYHKETKFYKSISEWDGDLDHAGIKEPSSPFEKIVECGFVHQTEQLKAEVSHQWSTLEQEKDDLLSWIHEVKTPLTAMNLMIERMEDERLKANLTYEWLRIHLLLDQQLHQKRLDTIENDLYMEDIDLRALIYKEIKTLQAWCIQKGLGVEVEMDITQVTSDAKWLSYVLRQLLTNAIKYSSDSDIFIRSYMQNGQSILEIMDTGCGIDSKDISRIFDKGFTSTARHFDQAATGMGLYLAQKAAKELHIQIEVSSKLNEGSTFKLVFPIRNEFLKMTRM